MSADWRDEERRIIEFPTPSLTKAESAALAVFHGHDHRQLRLQSVRTAILHAMAGLDDQDEDAITRWFNDIWPRNRGAAS